MRAMEPIESERPKPSRPESRFEDADGLQRLTAASTALKKQSLFGLSEKHFQIDPTWNLSARTRVRYRWIETVLTPDRLLSRNIEEVTRIITPICNTDPAMKVSDARVGPASARE